MVSARKVNQAANLLRTAYQILREAEEETPEPKKVAEVEMECGLCQTRYTLLLESVTGRLIHPMCPECGNESQQCLVPIQK